MMYDFIIVGAGITGAMIARTLSKYDVSVLVLEKENDVGNHATLANSAIIHSGHDPKHGTLKARFCVEGNRLYDTLEKELKIPLLRSGGLLLARNAAEVDTLKAIYENAKLNNVPGMKLLEKQALKAKEPNISKTVIMGLDLPTTKITYPWEVALKAMENAINNGVFFAKNTEVFAMAKTENGFDITTNNGVFKSKQIINAAGAFAGKVAAMVENHVPYEVKPRRGEYLVLDRRVKGFLNHTLYPVPNNKGKGTLIVPQVHGNILIGPTNTPQSSLYATPNDVDALSSIKENADKLMTDIPYHQVIRTFAGVRASIDHEDFYIDYSREVDGFMHVAGIDSPGLTAAPAIAEYVVNSLIKSKTTLDPKPNFNPNEPECTMYHALNTAEKKAAFATNKRYGKIICKCERITEGDLMQHITRTLGADTIKGMKKRARVGSGLCQGGYCEHETIKVLAKASNKDQTEIDYYDKDTPVLLKETKVKL